MYIKCDTTKSARFAAVASATGALCARRIGWLCWGYGQGAGQVDSVAGLGEFVLAACCRLRRGCLVLGFEQRTWPWQVADVLCIQPHCPAALIDSNRLSEVKSLAVRQ